MEAHRLVAAALQRIVDKLDPHEGRYRMLFESSPLPMWVFDASSLRYLAVNDAAVRLYGYSRDEFLGMTVEDLRPQGAGEGEAFREFLRRESGSMQRGGDEAQRGHLRHEQMVARACGLRCRPP